MKKNEKMPIPDVVINEDTLCLFIGYHLKRAFNLVQSDLAMTLKPLELRMLTYTALVLIVDNPGLSQAQIADAMGIERPNLVVIIDELEQRELITRERTPTDRRVYSLNATLAGRRLCKRAVAADIAHENRLFAGIDEKSRASLIQILSEFRKLQSS